MVNLVFVTGGFCSGSTLMFTLFRRSGEFYSLYEPLHEHLPVHMFAPLRVYGHHFHVQNYFDEYRGFSAIPKLHDAAWGREGFYLDADEESPRLFRYLSYVVGMAFGRQARVMLQFNRASFRMQWLRARFPGAAVIHIYRDCEQQWKSIVRRTQLAAGRDDVGQGQPDFNGMGIARWCDDLSERFPQLEAGAATTGRERFQRLWELTFEANRADSDISVSLEDLTTRFTDVFGPVWETADGTSDWRPLQQWVVPPSQQRPIRNTGRVARKLTNVYDRLRWMYAGTRVRMAGGKP